MATTTAAQVIATQIVAAAADTDLPAWAYPEGPTEWDFHAPTMADVASAAHAQGLACGFDCGRCPGWQDDLDAEAAWQDQEEELRRAALTQDERDAEDAAHAKFVADYEARRAAELTSYAAWF